MTNISVCMAVYNGSNYIEAQLNSILKQLSDADEIIISDDGSIDDSIQLILNIDDPRIKLIHHGGVKNIISNFENALNHASGRYIFLSDQDDIWETDKVHNMLACLKEHDLVVCDCTIINQNKVIISKSYFELRKSGEGFIKNLMKNSYMGCCMAFNSFVLEKALPFPKNIPMHDWWIGLVAQVFGRPFFYKKALVKYRRHDNNASPLVNYNRYSFFEKINFRINLLWALFRIRLGK